MASTSNLIQCLSPLRFAGPIFDKELRAASRRSRSYGLRAGYVALLTVLIVSAWYQFTGLRNANAAFTAAGLSNMAVGVTSRVIWFQFVAGQLIVAALLSSSLGGEMRSGALDVLMTTPTTGLHIMAGKLFSGLLQVSQFLAISLPVLAVVRALGGVPWGLVFACFCITITAVAFAGTLSLLLSTYWHHPYDALSACAAVYLFLWVVLPAVAITLVSVGQFSQSATFLVLDLVHPFRALYACDPGAWHMRTGGQGRLFFWPVHCLIMIGVAATVLCLSMWRLRRAVRAEPFPGRDNHDCAELGEHSPAGGRMALRRRRLWKRGNLAVGAMALAACAVIVKAGMSGLHNVEVYAYYFAWGLWTVALLRLAVSVAGGIAGEKESGAWPVLLTTPLDDDQILRNKTRAALWGNAVLLISAQAVEMCFLLSASTYKALSLSQGVLSAVASTFFVIAAGLYFGVRLRNTTAAIAATLGAYLCINYLVCGRFNPLFGWMIWSQLSTASNRGSHLALLGFGMGSAAFVLDAAVGVFLVRQAVRIMRTHIF